MMEFLKVTLLAVLQGIAEFLPISSSGHLVIAQHSLGVNDGGLRLDIFLHLGTLISIVAFYRIVVSRLLRGLFWRSATWESRREEIMTASGSTRRAKPRPPSSSRH